MTAMMKGKITKLWALRTMSWDSLSLSLNTTHRFGWSKWTLACISTMTVSDLMLKRMIARAARGILFVFQRRVVGPDRGGESRSKPQSSSHSCIYWCGSFR